MPDKPPDLKDDVDVVFGADVKASAKTKGSYRFHDANLLFFPVRSNKRAYYMATCPALLREAVRTLGLGGYDTESLNAVLDFDVDKLYLRCGTNANLHIEDWELDMQIWPEDKRAVLSEFVNTWLPGEPGFLLLSDDKMAECAGEGNLPVIARNYLENGISKNLWYEELVPRHCIFYTLILADPCNAEFDSFITSNIVQIGANETVGYGLCQFTQIIQ